VIEIAGGIIIAVLFFIFLPHILAFGLLAAAAIALLFLLFMGALFAWIAPLPALMIASAILLLTLYARFSRKENFRKYGIEQRLHTILQLDVNLAKRIVKEGWRGGLDLKFKRGFTLEMRVSKNKNFENLSATDIFVKVYRLGEEGALCSLYATRNECGGISWNFTPLRNVDANTLTSLRLALDEYIEEYESGLAKNTPSEGFAPYSPFPKQSTR
jgi:hypothetical protein